MYILHSIPTWGTTPQNYYDEIHNNNSLDIRSIPNNPNTSQFFNHKSMCNNGSTDHLYVHVLTHFPYKLTNRLTHYLHIHLNLYIPPLGSLHRLYTS